MAWTGRSIGARCGATTREVEEALKIAGPVTYPWGPNRPRYPYRAHELNAAALALARGCEALGIKWTETPLATLSAPRGLAHPCVYRGFCVTGCSTNAKQSALVTWIPRAIAAGAEIRDLAMVGRIEVRRCRTRDRRALSPRGTVAVPAGAQRRGGGLRDRDAAAAAELGDGSRYPEGLANSSGLVGRNFMVQSNQAVWGTLGRRRSAATRGRRRSRSPSIGTTTTRKDFFGGYCYMSQGPLPQLWANTLSGAHGLWGERADGGDGATTITRSG